MNPWGSVKLALADQRSASQGYGARLGSHDSSDGSDLVRLSKPTVVRVGHAEPSRSKKGESPSMPRNHTPHSQAQSVEWNQLGLLDRAVQNAELVPECKVFQLQRGSRFEG